MYLALLLLAGFFCDAAQAAKYLALDTGVYVDNLVQRFQAPAGYANEVSTISGFFRVRRAVGIRRSKNWGFEPGFWMLLPWRSGSEGFAKTFTFQLDLAFTYDLFKRFALRAGPGIHYELTTAVGQNVTLNNGGGTSTFYVPGGASNVFLFTLGTGFELKVYKQFSLNADAWVSDLGSGARRRYEGALSVGYRL